MSTTTSYITGFISSVLLTLAAFFLFQLHLATHHAFPTHVELRVLFVILAVTQMLVQLVCFLHVGRRQNNHYNSVALGFALFVVFVIVGGSLWIMANLNTNAALSGTYINNLVNVQNEND
jgi:cytochrome o ubiquinol oxidase operon protein cyoD